MSHSVENPMLAQTPSTHTMNLRTRTPIDYTNKMTNADKSIDMGSCSGLMTGRAPLRTMNSALFEMGATAARKLRTVKRAWGNFKAKLRPHGRKRQRLWTVSSAFPETASPNCNLNGTYRVFNSPLSPSVYQTPNTRTRSYRQLKVSYTPSTPGTPGTLTFGTPETEMTPLNLNMVSVSSANKRRSQRLANQTTPGSVQGSARKRTTPRRGTKVTRSPGRFLRDLNSVTCQLQAFQTMEKGFSDTIEKQDSNTTLTEIPIQPAPTDQDDNQLGTRASKRISNLRLKQLEDSAESDEDAATTPKTEVTHNVEQEWLV